MSDNNNRLNEKIAKLDQLLKLYGEIVEITHEYFANPSPDLIEKVNLLCLMSFSSNQE